MNRKYASTRFLAAAALALGLAAGANAAPADAGPGAMMSGQGMQGHHMSGKQGERGMRGLARLHDDLKLDARQEALWGEAASASREAHGAMRERFRTQHEEMAVALKQPNADLRALAKRSDDLRAEMRKQHEATRDRWLTVYDSLNSEQKEKARVFLAKMFERSGHHSQQGRKPA